ncbi:hypothetical protein D3C84_1032270 [compost metagenome]
MPLDWSFSARNLARSLAQSSPLSAESQLLLLIIDVMPFTAEVVLLFAWPSVSRTTWLAWQVLLMGVGRLEIEPRK